MYSLVFTYLVILGINQSIAQECSVRSKINILYPTTKETYTLDLNEIFQGENMTFSSDDPNFKVVGYTNPVDSGQALPSQLIFVANAIYTRQDNQEWMGQTSLLGTINQQFYVYESNFSSKQSPSFKNGTALLQGEKQIKCHGLTYINSHQVIVDCSYDDAGFLGNQWQIIDTIDQTKLALVVPSSNNQMQLIRTQGLGRIIKFWRNIKNGKGLSNYNIVEYLFRGTLSNYGQASFLEVFLLEKGIPQKDPQITLNKDNITNFQMVDFEITNNGTCGFESCIQVWVLNKTNFITTYNFNETSQSLELLSVIMLNQIFDYISFGIEIDQKFQSIETYSIILSRNSQYYNIEQWVAIKDQEPTISGYYTVPEEIQYNGFSNQIDINANYISIRAEQSVYFFQRRFHGLQPDQGLPFRQDQVLFAINAIYTKMNNIPEALLSFTPDRVQVSLQSKPALISKIVTAQTGNVNVFAICQNFFYLEQNATANINYEVLLEDNITILKTGWIILPNKTFYPVNRTIDVAEYLSGPLINIQGIVTPELENSGQQYLKESQILDTTISDFTINLQGYPTEEIIYVLNCYDKQSKSLLQLLQTSTQIQGYLCNKRIFDVAANCISLGTLEQQEIVQKSAFMYTNIQQPYAFLILPSSNSTINVYEVQWNSNDKTGSINVLYTTIRFAIKGYSPCISDFTVVGDRLFVVLSEISQIWVYQIENKEATRLYMITQQNFKSESGFYPIGITGNFTVHGPIIFINNQMEVLIISTAADRIEQIGSISYPLELPGMTTSVILVNTELLIIQYKEEDQIQQQISQYSLVDLTKPTIVKTLPLYGSSLRFPFQVSSDENFLYIRMSNNMLNIYKPSSSAHKTLYMQYANLDLSEANMVISGTSAGPFSYVSIINGEHVKNFRLYIKPVITFVPGSYENQYLTYNTYALILRNSLGSVPLIYSQTISIFNSQLEIKINQKKQQQDDDARYVVQKQGQTVFDIQTDKFITGGVALYTLDCPLCRTGNITIINHLTQRYINGNRGVSAIANYPTQDIVFLQTSSVIFEFKLLESKAVHNLSKNLQEFINCNVLYVDESRQKLLSICEQRIVPLINIQILDLTKSPYLLVFNQSMPSTYDPISGLLIGDTIFLLATNFGISSRPAILIINIDYTRNSIYLLDTLICPDPRNFGVNDFTVTAIKNLVGQMGTTRYNLTYYSIIWTCQTVAQGVQLSTFILDQQTQFVKGIQPQKILNTSKIIDLQQATKFPLLIDTIYLQVKTLSKQTSEQTDNQNIILTTNNMMSFIFQLSFQIQDFILSIVSQKLVVTLPPYGQWTAMSSLGISDGLVAIPYQNNDVKQVFIAVYNLEDLDYSKSYTSPFLMLGGYYESIVNMKNLKLVLNIQKYISEGKFTYAKILLSNPFSFVLGFSEITVQPHIQIVVNVTEPFTKQTVLITAENYYDKQQFNIEVDYSEQEINRSGGLKWWVWIQCILTILLITVGVTFAFIKSNQGRRPQQPLLSQ